MAEFRSMRQYQEDAPDRYRWANVLRERPRRRMNYTTLFLVFTLILYVVTLVIFH